MADCPKDSILSDEPYFELSIPWKGETETMKEVTAAMILKNHQVLIAQRAGGDELAGKWEFPGGKTEVGETPQECLKREIKEELDVKIEVLDFMGESIYTYERGTIRLMAYWCKWISGDFSLRVHSRMVWANRDELDLYEFAPADIPLVKKLQQSSLMFDSKQYENQA